MYKNKPKKETRDTVSKPDDLCQVDACKDETTVALMKVFNKQAGRYEVNCFGGSTNPKKPSYGYVNNGLIVMYEQYDFKRWICRCAKHYLDDVESSGKKALNLRVG